MNHVIRLFCFCLLQFMLSVLSTAQDSIPNPATDLLIIESLNKGPCDALFKLYDNMGKLVNSSNLHGVYNSNKRPGHRNILLHNNRRG